MTSLYTAIMQAADHIEQNPKEFSFFATLKPNGCGSPGCALGWIGYFAGGDNYQDVARNVLKVEGASRYGDGSPHFNFYRRMDVLAGGFSAWAHDASGCARALRLYAEKYHKPAAPDWTALASGTDLLGESSLAETRECVW